MHGRPLADRCFDVRTQTVQALLRRHDVVERVPELCRYQVGYVKSSGAIIDITKRRGERRVGYIVLRNGRGYVRLSGIDDPQDYREVGYVDADGRIFRSGNEATPIAEVSIEASKKMV